MCKNCLELPPLLTLHPGTASTPLYFSHNSGLPACHAGHRRFSILGLSLGFLLKPLTSFLRPLLGSSTANPNVKQQKLPPPPMTDTESTGCKSTQNPTLHTWGGHE